MIISVNLVVFATNLSPIVALHFYIAFFFRRARYLLLLMFGEDHPEMATCDSNIAIILHTIRDYKNSLLFLESTKRIHEK